MRSVLYVLGFFCCIAGSVVRAENITFPSGAGVVDVSKPPFNADRTGKIDATIAFQSAIDTIISLRDNHKDMNFGMFILYVPNGTYTVTNTIRWKWPPYTIGPHMMGQSRAGTILRLKDSTFTDTTKPRHVLHTGYQVAQNFNKGIHNLTVNIGKGNPGASGIFWYGNNEALLSDVNIISEDGLGQVGLDLGDNEQGPACARRVYVKGFNYGVKACPLNSITITQLSVEGQKICGVRNNSNPLYIDSLTSKNSVPALICDGGACMAVINANLMGGSPLVSAMTFESNEYKSYGYLRNITTSGYKQAVECAYAYAPTTAKQIPGEYTMYAPVSLFEKPGKGLNLPIKRAPEPTWENDTTKWVIVDSAYCAGRTGAKALQAAIDDPTKTVVCIPRRTTLVLDDTVYLRGNIRLLIGTGGVIEGKGALVVANGKSSIVKLQNISTTFKYFPLDVTASRTVVFESFLLSYINVTGAAEIFITDACCPMYLDNPKAKAWAWHYNAEGSGEGYMLNVKAGTAWIFGWKDEGNGQSVRISSGAAEIIGFLNYSSSEDKKDTPQFEILGGRFSVAAAHQTNFSNMYYKVLAKETHGDSTKVFSPDINPQKYNMSLFTSGSYRK